MDGPPFSIGDRVLGAALALGGCLPEQVSGAFFRAGGEIGSGSDSDSETDSNPISSMSPVVYSSSWDSDFSICVGGGLGGSLRVGIVGASL